MLLRRKRVWALCSILIITILILSGCGSENTSVEKSANDSVTVVEQSDMDRGIGFTNSDIKAEYAGDEYVMAVEETGESPASLEINRKIIKSARMELETLDFDITIDAIIKKTESIGGYVENSNITGGRLRNKGSFQDRYASFTLRIPEEFLDRFMHDINEVGNVILSENTGTDITGEYFDSEARLESLKIQEERLLEILKKAETVEDIIELERELSNVRYQIENLTGTLRKWDNMVSYATLQISVYEVEEIEEPEPVSLGDKISSGFSNSIKDLVKLMKNFIILLAILTPYIIIVAIIIFIVRRILKKIIIKKKDDRKDDGQ